MYLGAMYSSQIRMVAGRHSTWAAKANVALAEDYPELRASDQFLELQAQLEGTENRINIARLRFNGAVSDYNAAIRRLPGTLVAAFGNFRRKAYFQAEEGGAQAPAVEFS
jgi:LemA protein